MVLHIVAARAVDGTGDWVAPNLQPLNVAGYVAVVGVLADVNLQMEKIDALGVFPIDHEFLKNAIPNSAFADPFANRVSVVAAFYAPHADYSIHSRFVAPQPRLTVNSNSKLTISDRHLELQSGLSLLSVYDSRFGVDLELPASWRFTEVTDADGQPVLFDRLPTEGLSRIHVQLGKRIAATHPTRLYFKAQSTPTKWLDDWSVNQIEFPTLIVNEATSHSGNLAVAVESDVTLTPQTAVGLQTLDEQDQQTRKIQTDATPLAYRFPTNEYRLVLDLERLVPSIKAKTYTFFTVTPTELLVHCELEFDVRQAKTDEFTFQLPLASPRSISIRSDQMRLKDYFSTDTNSAREWTVLLSKAQLGTVKLLVTYRQPVDESQLNDIRLSPVSVSNVPFQTSMAAVEGSTELDIEIETDGRSVDIGELSGAAYSPGRNLLGAFSWPSEKGSIAVRSSRRPIFALPSAIVQRAEMITSLSPNGHSQTAARFQLVTKQPFLRIELPADSVLWSIQLNGEPAKPLIDENVLLVSLFDNESTTLCDLQVVFQSSVDPFGLVGKISSVAPSLSLRESVNGSGTPVPLVDLKWRLVMPDGYDVANTNAPFQSSRANQRPSLLRRLGNWLSFFGENSMPLADVSKLSRASQSYQVDSIKMAGAKARPAFREASSWADQRSNRQNNEPDEIVGRIQSGGEAQLPKNSAPSDAGGGGGRGGERGKGGGGSKRGGRGGPPVKSAERNGRELDDGTVKKLASTTLETNPRYAKQNWALSGLRSLDIELTEKGHSVDFFSLGQHTTLKATIVNDSKIKWIATGVALLIGFLGILLTHQRPGKQLGYLLAILLIACLLPLLGQVFDGFQPLSDGALLAVIGLAIYFGIVALVMRVGRTVNLIATRLSLLLLCVGIFLTANPSADAQQIVDDTKQLLALIDEIQNKPPVGLPKDAIIIPFDATDPEGRAKAEQLLLPYEYYIDLISRAEVDPSLNHAQSPVDYILSSANYSVDLTLEEDLVVHGMLHIELLVDKQLAIALPFSGGALADARVDGQPAKLQFVASPEEPQQKHHSKSQRQSDPKKSSEIVLLHLKGKGSKRIEFTVHVGLKRQGGWRSLTARLPVGLTRGLNIKSPSEKTEVRLTSNSDRRSIEATADQVIQTVLSPKGDIHVQWKPSTASQTIDQSLTAESDALFDVREDGLRLAWLVDLSFRGAERDTFSLAIPDGFLVEKVSGENVRAWDVSQDARVPELAIRLLSPATDQESFLIEMSKRDFTIGASPEPFSVPHLSVLGAALDRGTVTIRRSPMIELKTINTQSASRVDVDPKKRRIDMNAIDESASPLGIQSYQSLRFLTTPFTAQIQANLLPQNIKAETQTILRLGQDEADFELRINFDIGPRPTYELSLDIPHRVDIHSVIAGQNEHWVLEKLDLAQRVHLFLPQGVVGQFSVYLDGSFPDFTSSTSWTIPTFQINGADSQSGQIAVQVDPSLRVSTTRLKDCESILLQQLHTWLNPKQRGASRLALRTLGSAFEATLNFSTIQPRISCETITNVRLTYSAIEETILLDFDIQQAGTRQVQFLLPQSMKDARIAAHLVREMTREPAPAPHTDMTRITLDLQDEIMGSYRIVVENDRPLTEASQDVPTPVVLTGETTQRFVTLQNAGRDEIQIQPSVDFQVLNRQLSQYAILSQKLGGGQLTMAYAAKQDARRPQLRFETTQRQSVETVTARIQFSKTVMVVDAGGAYRAMQTFQISNRSEQYLDIELPDGAQLLTVWVAGTPIKPVQWTEIDTPRRLRIPLVKTPTGDLDYPVQLKYAGQLGDLARLEQIEFPVINTLNVNVQSSQLHLRLPESYQWMNFGGTMTKVDSRGELEQGFLSYKAQQIQELTEQIKKGKGKYKSFSSKRALSNLKTLEKEMNTFQQDQAGSRQNGQTSELDLSNARSATGNILAIQKAQEEVMTGKDKDEIIPDNRANFNGLLTDQKLRIARNEVTRKGNNWDVLAEDAMRNVEQGRQDFDIPFEQSDFDDPFSQNSFGAEIPVENRFDGRWLDRNKLDVQTGGVALAIPNQPSNQRRQSGQQAQRFHAGLDGIVEDESLSFASPQDQSRNKANLDEFDETKKDFNLALGVTVNSPIPR